MNDKKHKQMSEADSSARRSGTEAGGSKPTPSIDSSPIRKYTDEGQVLIMEAMKVANSLPSGNAREFYASYSSFVTLMDDQAKNIATTISDIMRQQEIQGNFMLRDADEKFEMLEEFNDAILERIQSNLDEVDGLKKKQETVLVHSEIQLPAEPRYKLSGTWNQKKTVKPITATLITGTNIARPQVNFKVPVDNSLLNPFVPIIKYKPNSLKPLAVLPEYDDAGNIESYLHPYEYELDKFEQPKEMFQQVTPEEPLLLSDTALEYIDKEAQLSGLVCELKKAKAIAVDLEHHSYRSFQGFTCLLQISTRTKDYVVDTLALREELHVLNEVFTDPKIVKVFHGAVCDIDWLQRDLAVYVVNMFDTAEAAKVLEFSRIGLQFLLKHYCNIDTDKAFQLADWRIRPLPESFIEYARKDTHYLLYIYDRIKNELIAKGESFLQSVFNKSTFLCKQRYCKPTIKEDTITNIYSRSKHVFDVRQMYAFKEMLYWRDKIARLEDESVGYVLPQHMALDIASKLPREMQGIIACCTPVPSLVRQHLHAIHQIIHKAREIPLSRSELISVKQAADARHKMQTTFDINNPLLCPHDNSHVTVAESNLPTLLDNVKESKVHGKAFKSLLKEAPSLSIYGQEKIRTLDAKGHIALDESSIAAGRLEKLLQLHCNEELISNEDDQNILNRSLRLSYQQRKFNTPYERYKETCRVRQVTEMAKEAASKAGKAMDNKAKDDLEEGTTSIEAADDSTSEQPVAAKPVPPKAEVDNSVYSDLLSLKQLKRKQKTELNKALLSGDMISFSGESYETPPKKACTEKTRSPFPFEINSMLQPEKSDDDDEGDVNDNRKRNAKQGKKSKKRKPHMSKADRKDCRQSSNRPVDFNFGAADYSQFQRPRQEVPDKRGRRGKGKPEDGTRQLHPNSRLAKAVKRTQSLFNLSSSSMKRK